MRTVHKFSARPGYDRNAGEFVIEMPRNADVLCVQMQDGIPRLWALVDDAVKTEMRRVVVIGTGWEVPADVGPGDYTGTYQDGAYVWHVFVTKPNAISPFVAGASA